MKSRRNNTEPNYWAAYADCMLALFMIALLLWILSSGKTIFANMEPGPGLPVPDPPTWDLVEKLRAEIKDLEAKLAEHEDTIKKLEDEIDKLEGLLKSDLENVRQELADLVTEKKGLLDRLANARKEVADLIAENKKLTAKVADLIAENKKLNRKPPIIELAEGNKKFRFSPGSASLSEDFRDELRFRTFPKLRKTLREFPRVDTIEIIGHTDGDPMQGVSNLDARVPGVILNNDPVARLKAGSNADLGLMRALAIRQEWQEWARKNGFAKDIDVRCYSAAQTIPANGAAGFNKLRNKAEHAPSRRIEIRVTDLKQ